MGVPLTYNIRSLLERKATSAMTALGIGLTVAVLVITFALTEGLTRLFAESGNPLQGMVMRKGADAELSSSVTDETYQVVRALSGIARSPAGDPLVSPEGVTVINLPSVEAPDGMNVAIRGLLPIGLEMRKPEIVTGKMFQPGLRQIIVGQAISQRYPAAQLGSKLRFGRGDWEVVGIFRSGATTSNSEIWADLGQIRGDFEQSGGSNVLIVRAESEATLKQFKTTVDDDRRLNSAVTTEKEYFASQGRSGEFLRTLGFTVAIIMAIGAAFAATNTMYAAVSRRSREIATLRAIGFTRLAILQSFVLESVFLALFGGVLGVLLALPMNGFTTGVGGTNFAEIAFQFRVSPVGIAAGLTFAAIIGVVGGLLPAWNASRRNVIQAMRDQ